ncbi:MAG: hypothetical protein MZV64_59415 [Ignavibacteriales bacterium]|nr:hypothetical protein [Ignavibacteriales bacterium]
MRILILASTLFFQREMGRPAGRDWCLILAAVFGATGWGMLITALARTPGPGRQPSVRRIMLIFGILGGSFINLDNMPPASSCSARSRPTPGGWTASPPWPWAAALADPGRDHHSALLIMGVRLVSRLSADV